MTPQYQQALAGIFESLDLATQNREQFLAVINLARGIGTEDDARRLLAMPGMRTFLQATALLMLAKTPAT